MESDRSSQMGNDDHHARMSDHSGNGICIEGQNSIG